MTTKIFSRVLLAVLLVLMSLATVQADTRIAAVNVSRLMENAPQAKTASDRIKAQFADREKKLVEEQAAIRKLEEQYRRDKDVVSAAERQKLENTLREKVREFKRKSDAFAADFSEARNQALNSLQSDIFKAIVEIAEKENYDLVVSESVLYASKKIDITDKVITRLQAHSGK
jgi:outer membrane protein